MFNIRNAGCPASGGQARGRGSPDFDATVKRDQTSKSGAGQTQRQEGDGVRGRRDRSDNGRRDADNRPGATGHVGSAPTNAGADANLSGLDFAAVQKVIAQASDALNALGRDAGGGENGLGADTTRQDGGRRAGRGGRFSGRTQGHHGGGRPAQPLRGQNAQQLQALFDALTGYLNDVAESYLPGGGAADLSKETTAPGQPLRRFFNSYYGDGKSAPAGADRPGAREISNAVSAQSGDMPNKAGLSDMFWIWGQFLDHDVDLTHANGDEFNVPIPKGDGTFDPDGTGTQSLSLKRADSVKNLFGVDQQVNSITALIDGSNVYGSTAEETKALRTGAGGLLRSSENGHLPHDASGKFYKAGDERANENIGLTSMHTLWMNEHNRTAKELAAENPTWSDDQLFDAARERVVAQMQAITYNEFLPALLGDNALGSYQGYTGVDAQISNSFSTAAYRLGHTLVSDNLLIKKADGSTQTIQLSDAFFRPDKFDEFGAEAILNGAANKSAQELDENIVDSLRNMVMNAPGSPRLDLAALNVQRGRDHGLPTLNQARAELGLRPITSFNDPIFRDGVGAELASVYDSPDQIDLWTGMLSERPVGDGLVGQTQRAVLLDQFQRLRAGDANWYEGKFSSADVAKFNSTTLSDVIQRNFGVNLQEYAFYTPGKGDNATNATA